MPFQEPATPLDDIRSEVSEDIVIQAYETLYYADSEKQLDEYIRDAGIDGEVREVFVVYGEDLWALVVSESEHQTAEWQLVSIRIETGECLVRCSMHANLLSVKEEIGDENYVLCHAWYGAGNAEKGEETLAFKELTGYYYQGKIVLSDYETVTEYDITQDSVRIMSFSNYPFPEPEVTAKLDRENDTAFFTKGGVTNTLTLERAINSGNAFREMNEIMKSMNGARQEKHLLYRVQSTSDGLYVLVPISNQNGSVHTFVYKYDFSTNVLLYVKKVSFSNLLK